MATNPKYISTKFLEQIKKIHGSGLVSWASDKSIFEPGDYVLYWWKGKDIDLIATIDSYRIGTIRRIENGDIEIENKWTDNYEIYRADELEMSLISKLGRAIQSGQVVFAPYTIQTTNIPTIGNYHGMDNKS